MQRVRIYEEDGAEAGAGSGKTKISVQLPKTANSFRIIPLADGLLKILRIHARGPQEYMVSGKHTEWAEVRTVQYRFAAILKKCGLQPFHFHLLRHSFASIANAKGIPMYDIGKALGHSSPSTTSKVYTHLLDRDHKDLLERMWEPEKPD